MAYTTGTIAGTFTGIDGTPLRGSVTIVPSVKVIRDAAGDTLLSGSVRKRLDENGEVSFTLPATNDVTLDPTGVTYTAITPTGKVVGISLSGGSTVQLADVMSVDPTAPEYAVEVTRAEFDALAAEVASGGGSGGGGSARLVPLIVFTGESNSGGYAQNDHATTHERSARPAVQIFNNYYDDGVTPAGWQNLQIDLNAEVNHSGLTNGFTHGWENGLANSVEAGEWASDVVYLVKTGQGGSVVSQWNSGGAFFTTFRNRVRAAMRLILDAGNIPVVYVWHSQGINDAIAGTNLDTWQAAEEDWFTRIRGVLGDCPIFMTRMMPHGGAYDALNNRIDAIAAADNLAFVIQSQFPTIAAEREDDNHWDYEGMKTMAARFVDATLAFGELNEYKAMRDFLRDSQGFFDPSDVDLPAAPANTVAPVVTGTPNLDQTLTSTQGTWTGATSYTYQWYRNATIISGATANTHVVVSADQGTTLTCRVTGTGTGGSTVAVSNGVAVAAAAGAPGNTVLPAITGGTALGNTLTVSNGTWSNSPTSYTYQWKGDGVAISGQTANTHVIVTGDYAKTLTCTVTATNGTGSTSATATGVAVPDPTVSSPTNVVWTSMTNATDNGGGVIAATGNGGGVSTVNIDATQPFEVIAYHPNSSTNAVVVCLDDNDDGNLLYWVWDQLNTFAGGVYEYNGQGNFSTSGWNGDNVALGNTPTPSILKMRKSGNDIIVSLSTDNGTTYTDVYTKAGALTGKTTMKIKVIFAIGSGQIRVAYTA